jgi:hypothetical protein
MADVHRDATEFTPYSAYLKTLENQRLSPIQYQVVQGFFYGVCASILSDDILHDVDHVLNYAGADFITHYRSHCGPLHADIAHLAAVIPSFALEATECVVEVAASTFEAWFVEHVPPPYNRVFTQLSDGADVAIIAAKPLTRPAHVAAIRKTMKRRARAHTPPARAPTKK